MTNEELALSYLAQARLILEEADGLYQRGAWNLVVRRCQEAVELALKGVLRFLGLEIPQLHDVAGVMDRYQDRLPPVMQKELPRLISISRRLSEERGLSFYGDEKARIPAERLYVQMDADSAMLDAKFVMDVCASIF